MAEKTVTQEIIDDIEGNDSDNLHSSVDGEETENKQKEEIQKEESESVISEEMVKELGLSNTFIGKPIKELGKSHLELQKAYSKQGNDIGELRKQIEILQEQATKKEEKQAIKETKDEFGEMPDPIDDPDGYKVWMKEFKTNLISEMKEEILKELSPALKRTEHLSTKEMIGDTIEIIQKSLPDGENALDVLNEYVAENKEYFEELLSSGKGRTPESLAKETIRDYKAKQFDKQNKLTDEEIKKIASDKAREQLIKKNEATKSSNLNTNSRENKKSSIISDIVRDLEQENGE